MLKSAATEEVKRIRPLCCLRRIGKTAFTKRIAPKKLTSNCFFASSTEVNSIGPDIPKPALLITTSMRSVWVIASSTADCTEFSSVTSQCMCTTEAED